MNFNTTTSVADITKFPSAESIEALSNVDTDFGSAFSDCSCFTREVLAPVELPVGSSVLDVFSVAFDDGATLLETYHTNRKDTKQKWESWRATKAGSGFSGQRQFTCMTVVKAMLSKSYPFIEYQRYAFLNISGAPTLVVQFSSQVPGVTFGDAFRPEALAIFRQSGTDATAKVTMQVFGYVQFLRSVWAKGRIISTTLGNEFPEGYRQLSRMIAEAVGKERANVTVSADSSVCPGVSVAHVPAEAVAKPVPTTPPVPRQRTLHEKAKFLAACVVIFVALRGFWFYLFLSFTNDECARTGGAERTWPHDVLLCQNLQWHDSFLRTWRPAMLTFHIAVVIVFVSIAANALGLSGVT